MDIKLVLYYLCIFTGAVCAAFFDFRTGTKRGYPKKTLVIFISFAVVSGFIGALFMGQLQNFIMSLTGLSYYPSRMRIFGGLLFMPVLIYFPVRYLAGDFREITDMFTPGAYLLLAFSKIGCAVYGCCYGTECSFGVRTQFEDHLCFPVQLSESALCFILFVVLFYVLIKKKHRKGAVYPTSLILYGVIRFFVEYLRYYPEAEKTYFFGINFWQTVSIVTVISGAVWLICIYGGRCREA